MPTLDATPPEHSPSTTDLLRRLRYAQALHQCAQALLQPASELAGQRRALTEALEHLRVAAEAGRAALYRNFADRELGFCSGIFAESCAPGIPSSLAGGVADRIPWSSVPAMHMRSQAAGQPIGGPTTVVFADAPSMREALLADGILSIQFFPLHLGAEWWGYIGFDDYHSAREWDEEELLLQRTAVAMIGGALRRWRTEAALQAAHDAVIVHQERQRLARELHDALTQSIYSIALFARAGGDALEHSEQDKARQILRTIETTAGQSLVEVRMLLFELQPADVLQGAFPDVLEARFNLVERRLGIRAGYTGVTALDPALHTILLPIALEALNNALRHAAATHVTVQVESDGEGAGMRMTIEDNGRGFDPDSSFPGLGLRTMHERAAAAGGSLQIDSAPGAGTRVHCVLPHSDDK
ncbi:MAG: GAF domain-containing sensor histidine kinase [Caldilineaceae bacterium]|nr:GAF domain-containing sensor histidine kinase [Caldilineaceae bacterium]